MSIADDVQELSNALSIGNYNAAPGGLTHGAPLQVEDLDATLKLVTYKFTYSITVAQYNRLLRRLREHGVEFRTREYMEESDWFFMDGELVRTVDIMVGKYKIGRKRRRLKYRLVDK